MVTSILPEILLLILAVILLILDPFLREASRRLFLGWVTAGGLLAILAASLLVGRPGSPVFVYGGMLRFDWLGFLFELFFLFTAAASALFFMDVERLNHRAESYLLLLAATLGMCLMASSADLIMLYLAIEMTSIPLYLLGGFLTLDEKSTESGFKYLLFGALTTTVLLYGFSLVYGFSGTTNLYALSLHFNQLDALSIGVILLVLAGLAFKVSLFPFQFWAPDVYEGSPTPVAGFLSTASKAAGFVVILRLFVIAFPALSASWTSVLAVLATLTMTVGNLIALTQKNIKRLLAYSSIAHAGYAMIGVVAYSQLGASSTIFYLIAYILTNLAAFGIVAAFGRAAGSDEIAAYRGLSRRNPTLALGMLAVFLSLAGMPPFGGFVAKLLVFAAAVQAGYVWLAVVGVLNSIVGLYYYLNVLKVVYLYRMDGEDEERHPVAVSRPYAIALAALMLGVILLGVVFAPWFNLAHQAVLSLF
jgi:NADH-quinone oxidoreductase subunit N